MIWATVSSRSCFCWLYRASPSLAAKNIINLILGLTIWWCPCVESFLVLLEEGVCYDQCVLLAKLLAIDLFHFVLQGRICLLLQVALDFLLFCTYYCMCTFGYMNLELPDVQAGFRKGRGTRDQMPASVGSLKKQESSRKTSTSALLTTPKPLNVDHDKLWKILQEMGTPDQLTCLLRSVCRSGSNS